MGKVRGLQWDFFLFAALGILAAFAFAPGLWGGFVLDDLAQIPYALHLKGPQWFGPDVYGMPRPGKNLLFMLLASRWSYTPVPWHLLGLLLHAFNATVLILVAQRFGFRRRSAVLIALVWALSPTNVSTVCWASCLNIQVATAGALLFLFFSVRATDVLLDGVRVALALLSLAVALFFYEAVAPIIFLPMLWRIARVGPRKAMGGRPLTVMAGGLLLVSLFLVWRALLGCGLGTEVVNEQLVGGSPLRLVVSSPYLMLRHAWLWLWPFGQQGVLLSIDFTDTTTLVALFGAIFAWVGIGFLLIRAWSEQSLRRAVYGCLWFVTMMVPLCNVLPLGNGPIADYYLYLSSIGLALTVVAGAERLDLRRRQEAGVSSQFATGALWVLLAWRIAASVSVPTWAMYWHNETAILRRTLEGNPDADVARGALAARLANEGHFSQAEALANEALVHHPALTHAGFALGHVYMRTARTGDAIVLYKALCGQHPHNTAAWALLGLALAQAGQPERAHEAYREALGLGWDMRYSLMIARNLSYDLFQTGDLAGAREVIDAALVKAPGEACLHQTAAVLAFQAGEPRKALEHASEAKRLGAPLNAALVSSIRNAAAGD